MHVFHMNDYPADPPRDKITDAHRVYPGDGVAPLGRSSATCSAIGFRGMLRWSCSTATTGSRTRWRVARTGLEKMKAAVPKVLRPA